MILTIMFSLLSFSSGTAEAAAGTGKKALIYVNAYGKTKTKECKEMGDAAVKALRQAGWSITVEYVGGNAPAGTTVASILNQMSQYDAVFFYCHGAYYAPKASNPHSPSVTDNPRTDYPNTGGAITLFQEKNLWLTYESVMAWSGNLSKVKYLYAGCCAAGCSGYNKTNPSKITKKGVIDALDTKGVYATVSFRKTVYDSELVQFSKEYVRRFASSLDVRSSVTGALSTLPQSVRTRLTTWAPESTLTVTNAGQGQYGTSPDYDRKPLLRIDLYGYTWGYN